MKSPFTLVRRQFERYLYGNAQVPWRVAETPVRRTVEKADLMAHNSYYSVVVTYLGKRVFRVTVYSKSCRSTEIVRGASNVYDTVVKHLNDHHSA
jgi:hypothetical protein